MSVYFGFGQFWVLGEFFVLLWFFWRAHEAFTKAVTTPTGLCTLVPPRVCRGMVVVIATVAVNLVREN